MSGFHGYELESSLIEKLEAFHLLLSTDARRLGLIGFPEDQLATEILRSLLFAQLIPPGYRIIDVGSGAGFPGIPLAVIGNQVDLVEPRSKAVGFLEKSIRTLALKANVYRGTAEQVASSGDCPPGEYVVARALAPAAQAARICAELCLPHGKILLTAKPEEDPPHLDRGFLLEDTVKIQGHGLAQGFHRIVLAPFQAN